ncbi:unnamed protein product [Cylindrotheca closterium]|uniref:EGF-like domain-containing protein n=1 Tax=Cylindrotheca closterium TaxID=2856 RepID=A0AAD2CEB2_9STRA|nr:unnamed protein product [Cylindrotheca closterium]
MMIVILRSLRLAIASVCLLAVVADQAYNDRPSFSEFEVELCDMPCQNNGNCVAFDLDNDGVLDPQCLCNTTFQGDLCETPRSCSLACENGGTCSLGDAWWLMGEDGSLGFIKEILYGCSFEGVRCEFPPPGMDERCDCSFGTNGPLCENTCDVACENGGECIFAGSEQRCRCAENFYGDQCENVCSKSCLNDGFCLGYPSSEAAGGFEEQCLCRAGFEGEQCETVTPCSISCQNEGVCKFSEQLLFQENGEDGFIVEYWQSIMERCIFRGLPISECFRLQQEEVAPYCDCPPTTFGNTCEITCDLDCQNGSTCQFHNAQNQFCSCETGFAGDLCQFECTMGCVNGGCNANATAQWCQCSPFYDGDFCETERTCDKTCFNDGKCEFDEGFRVYSEMYYKTCIHQSFSNCPGPDDIQRCACAKDFVGSECSQPCPCQNEGRCITRYYSRKLEDIEGGNYYNNGDDQPYFEDNIDDEFGGDGEDYYCQCPFGYGGRDCQLKMGSDNCDFNCENGGYCRDYAFNDCVCPEGFTGRSCETEIDACNNQCKNGGVCTTDAISTQGLGNRALQGTTPTFAPTSAPIIPRLFSGSCSCPEGYSGDFCERKACGSGYCSHGGSCIELPSGQTTSAGDNYVCDCSTSTLEETVGIGRNCDAIVYSTCPIRSNVNPNEAWSCAGYGKCFKEGQDSIPQCSCDTTFTGPRCEFDINDPKDVAWSECSLECSNGGVCLKGATKPIADIFIPFTEGTKKSGLFDYQTRPDFEYCYCPDGFFGVQCDKQYDICGNREHICFHGSKCENDGGAWGCDCRGTESAGLYCQYKATDDCGDSNLDTFCTNEATCTFDFSSDALCTCVEGWEGTKCETEVKLAAPSGGEGDYSSAPTLAGTLLSVLSVALLSAIA